MAQRITRLTTDQKIAGSNPAEIDFFSNHRLFLCISVSNTLHFLLTNVYGHTTLNAPVLVRSLKLGQVSTWMGDRLGILGARLFFLFFLDSKLIIRGDIKKYLQQI